MRQSRSFRQVLLHPRFSETVRRPRLPHRIPHLRELKTGIIFNFRFSSFIQTKTPYTIISIYFVGIFIDAYWQCKLHPDSQKMLSICPLQTAPAKVVFWRARADVVVAGLENLFDGSEGVAESFREVPNHQLAQNTRILASEKRPSRFISRLFFIVCTTPTSVVLSMGIVYN